MTSEYVTIGHPDRMADYISEYILDRYLEIDPNTRYALEVQVKDNHISLAGEVTSIAQFTKSDYEVFVRDALYEIGYTYGYAKLWGDGNTINPLDIVVDTYISSQSPDIAQGVDDGGWGDQGIFWGMAVNDPSTNYMPRDQWLAKRIGDELYLSHVGGLDIKTQVMIVDDKVEEVVVAIPVRDNESDEHVRAVYDFVEGVVDKICGKCHLIVNGTGRYVRHSSMGDCGTTGRKLAVDFYGGNCRVGGGSPWTKDPTKADLTLNLYARKLALDYIKGHPDTPKCFVSISCCIGRKDIHIEFYDDHLNLLEHRIESKVASDIIDELGLRKPIYTLLARNGLFSIV